MLSRLGRRDGFTLIELLVAAFLAFFIIVTVGELVLVSEDAWDRGFVKLTAQQEGAYLVEDVTIALRSRSAFTISNFGTGIQNQVLFDTDAASLADNIIFYCDGSNVYRRNGSGSAQRVIPVGVAQMQFSANAITPGALDMDITLSDGAGNNVRYIGTASPRN